MKIIKCVLIILLILMLFFSSFSNAEYLKSKKKNLDLINVITIFADSPDWGIDDSWIYDLDLSLDIEDEELKIIISLSFRNMVFTIEDISSDYYIMDLNGDVNGDFYFDVEGFPRISGDLSKTEMNGKSIIEQNNYGLTDINLYIDGTLKINRIPIKLSVDLIINFNPEYSSIEFPLDVGNYWITNWSDVSIGCTVDLPGITSLFPSIPDQIVIDNSVDIGGNNLICTKEEDINLNIGEYKVYNISIDDKRNIYYSKVLGNIVQISPIIIEHDNFQLLLTFELISTTYEMPGSPDIPEKPTGQNQGKINTYYNYTASTIDHEGDDIYYFFKWGDGNNSGWIGPKLSGETITVNYKWTKKGNYQIQVKAKDIYDHETRWSESLYFSIPKNKLSFKERLIILIEKYLDNYQIFNKLK